VGARSRTDASHRISIVHDRTDNWTHIDAHFDGNIGKATRTLRHAGDRYIVSVVIGRTVHRNHTCHISWIAIKSIRTLHHTILTMNPLTITAGIHTHYQPIVSVVTSGTVCIINTDGLALGRISKELMVCLSVERASVHALIFLHVMECVVGAYSLATFGRLVFFV